MIPEQEPVIFYGVDCHLGSIGMKEVETRRHHGRDKLGKVKVIDSEAGEVGFFMINRLVTDYREKE